MMEITTSSSTRVKPLPANHRPPGEILDMAASSKEENETKQWLIYVALRRLFSQSTRRRVCSASRYMVTKKAGFTQEFSQEMRGDVRKLEEGHEMRIFASSAVYGLA